MPARTITSRLLEAVASCDVDRIAWCFTEDATWANVPHPPAVGRDGIRAMFGGIVPRCERIRWDVVSASYAADVAWLERVDRFWIDGREYAIECNGVFRVDERSGLIREVRDYVDLGVWRARLAEGGISR